MCARQIEPHVKRAARPDTANSHAKTVSPSEALYVYCHQCCSLESTVLEHEAFGPSSLLFLSETGVYFFRPTGVCLQ